MMRQLLGAWMVLALAAPVAAEPQAGGTVTESYVKADEKWVKILKIVEPSTLWYLWYAWGKEDGESYNREYIGRGYLTLKFKPTAWFQPRITLDTTQDSSGDFKVRLKYLYGKLVLPMETDFVTEPSVEFGLVHGPWFDYEEHINLYRAQGTMFIERNKVLNSADAGVTFAALLGPKLSQEYQDSVSKYYPGKWGSLSFGVYNGGGYHAAEENQDKVFESRLTVRPLGWVLPNLSLSHFFVFGKGNTPAEVCDEEGNCILGEPRWMLNAFMAAFEHQYFVLTAQFATGEGNQKGDKIDAQGKALSALGYSGFLEVKLPWISSSLIGRYDHWEWGGVGNERVIAGVAFHFYKHCFLLANLDWVMHQQAGKPDDWQAGLVMQVKLP